MLEVLKRSFCAERHQILNTFLKEKRVDEYKSRNAIFNFKIRRKIWTGKAKIKN